MKAPVLAILVLLAAIDAGGSASTAAPTLRPAPVQNPAVPGRWETGPPPAGWDATSLPITPDRMVDLPADKEAAASALLEKSAVVLLDPSLYLELFPGKGYPADADKLPVLVRAVTVEKIDGGFNAEQKGDELSVVYAGRGAAGMKKRKPLVLLLPRVPRRLFVSTVVNNF